MQDNSTLVPRYTGQYACDYDTIVEIIQAYEYVHSTDRTVGAMRSLMALHDDALAWKEHYKLALEHEQNKNKNKPKPVKGKKK